MTDNFIAINDISCDIDSWKDLESIKRKVGEIMIKCEVIIDNFTLKAFDELKNIKRARRDVKGTLYLGDTFECTEKMAEYLTGNNQYGKAVVKIIELDPQEEILEEQDKTVEEVVNEKIEKTIDNGFEKPKKKKSKK